MENNCTQKTFLGVSVFTTPGTSLWKVVLVFSDLSLGVDIENEFGGRES